MTTPTTPIVPGIYFGMDENTYHATPWIGSSAMKMLYASPPDYWFDSPMNPMREPDTQSFAQAFGTALHSRILYGEDRFKKDYSFLAGETGDTVSAEGLKDWIKQNGGVPAKLKADNERMIAEEFGTRLLTQKVYEKIMVSAAMIVKNPNLAQAFIGGWPEVSVFWEQDGIPCKARFDYLKSRTIVDLKSFRSKDRVSTLDRWIIQDMFNYRYDIQVAHYLNGHRAAAKLFDDGNVFSAPGVARPDDEWLRKALLNEVGWTFVFYKADGMPLSKSYQIPWGSAVHDCGAAAVKTGLAAYADNIAKFGTDAWVNVDEPYMLDDHDIPKWL